MLTWRPLIPIVGTIKMGRFRHDIIFIYLFAPRARFYTEDQLTPVPVLSVLINDWMR